MHKSHVTARRLWLDSFIVWRLYVSVINALVSKRRDNFKVNKCVHWTRTKSCVSILIKLTSKRVVLKPILCDGGESPGDDVTTYNTDSGDAWWSLKTAIKMSADDCVYWETPKTPAQCAWPNNRVTETSGRETSARRVICPVHPGFSPLYVRRVSVRLASALPASVWHWTSRPVSSSASLKLPH